MRRREQLARVTLVWLLVLAWGLAPAGAWAQAENAAEAPANGAARDEEQAAPAAPPEPAEEAAANVADQGQPAAEPAPAEAEAAPEELLTPEELTEYFELPEFAEEQPGFIPDLEPSDLLVQPPSAVEGFSSALEIERLPPGLVTDIISLHEARPELDLPDTHARIVVPSAGVVRGSTETKQFHIEGGLVMYYRDITLAAERADIDEKEEVAVLYGNVNIIDPEYSLKAEDLRIDFEDKRFEAQGFIQFRKGADPQRQEPDLSLPKKDRLREYFAGQSFELFCNKLFYDWESKELTALESVRLTHPDFNGSMERLDYNDETKEYELSGEIVLEVSDYDWIFENQLIDEEDVSKVEALTDGNTVIKCGRVVYSEESGVAEFYARPGELVSFEQPTRGIKAAYIEVNDQTKDFYAEGGTGQAVEYQQTEGEWLFAGGLLTREETEEDVSEALAGPLTATAATFTYNFDRKRLELLGQVRVTAGERMLEAAELVQDETAKFFLLRGNVLLKPDRDSQVIAAQVYVDTESDVVTLVGFVQGELRSEDLPLLGVEEEAGPLPAGQPAAPAGEVAEGVFTMPTERGASAAGGEGEANVAEGG